jgi:hypothetical protein
MTSDLSPALACLAKSSPDVASVSWLVVNLLCMAWSLYVAVYNIWTSSRKDDSVESNTANNTIGDNDDADTIFPDMSNVSESGLATVEYLVWSLMTTFVWTVEVALRTAFPPELTETSVPQNRDENLTNPTTNTNECEISPYRQHQHSLENREKEIFHLGCVNCESTLQQQPKWWYRRGALSVELLLAIFFLGVSAFDCWNWRAQVAEHDVLGNEVGTWISIFGYFYMSYETSKAISRKRKLKTSVHWTATPTATSILMQRRSFSYKALLGDDSQGSTRAVCNESD